MSDQTNSPRDKLPPQFRELLAKLEASGAKIEVESLEDLLKNGLSGTSAASSAASDNAENPEKTCDCPACTMQRRSQKARRAFADALGIPPGIQASLDRQAEFIAKKLSENVEAIVEPMKLELQRQVEINDNNMARIAGIQQAYGERAREVSELRTQLADLDERFRKQTSLLHKRVTKRKGEVKDVKVRVAATRGRVTRVEKKLT